MWEEADPSISIFPDALQPPNVPFCLSADPFGTESHNHHLLFKVAVKDGDDFTALCSCCEEAIQFRAGETFVLLTGPQCDVILV